MLVYEFTGMINEDMVYILAKEDGWPIPFHQSQFNVLALDDEWEMSREMDLKLSVNFRTDQVKQMDLLFHAALDLVDVYHY